MKKSERIELRFIVGTRRNCFTNPIRRRAKKVKQAHQTAAYLQLDEKAAEKFVNENWETMGG